MATNWKKHVEKQNKKTYRWPEGWDTRDKVAEQLECSPDRVSQLLAPGIRSGEVKVQQFPVWDDILKRVVKVTGYSLSPSASEDPVGLDRPDLEEAVLAIRARRPKATAWEVQKLLPRRFRGHAPLTAIEEILG